MPLRDHFRSPVNDFNSPDGLFGGWPMANVQQLVAILPPRLVARPRVHLSSSDAVEIGEYELGGGEADDFNSNNRGVATATWTSSQPTLAVETELADFDEYEVRVYDEARGRRLVAAIEIISPANKDRPEGRAQFVSKCAAMLRSHVSLVLVDIVTTREFNLYAELLDLIGERDTSLGEVPPATGAVACHPKLHGAGRMLEAWNVALTVGQPLPVLPLWLSEELAISLDLEASYEQTCSDLRIA